MHNSEMTVDDLGEFGLIRRIASTVVRTSTGVGIGDDAAVIPLGEGRSLLATVDMMVEGIHFNLSHQHPFVVGRRAVAINMSDIAAMGGQPAHCLISLAIPPRTPLNVIDDLYRGMSEEALPWGLSVMGGNITRTTGPLSIDVTMLGFVESSHVVLRTGAQVGDLLAVTGTLGGAAALRLATEAGLGHTVADPLRDLAVPKARIAEASQLATCGVVHGMLDLSDGLAGDVSHLCDASQVGATINADLLPIRDTTVAVAQSLGLDATDLALSGGEDYELLTAVAPENLEAARECVRPTRLTVIGRCLPSDAGITIEQGGVARPVKPTGWLHF